MVNLVKRIKGALNMKCKFDGKEFKSWKDVPMSDDQRGWCKRHLRSDDKISFSDPSFTHDIKVDFSLPKSKRLRRVRVERCPGCDYGSDSKVRNLIVERDIHGKLVGRHDIENFDDEI